MVYLHVEWKDCDLCAASFQTREQVWYHGEELHEDCRVQEWGLVNIVLKVSKQETCLESMEKYYIQSKSFVFTKFYHKNANKI